MKTTLSYQSFSRKFELSPINFLLTEKDGGPNWSKSKALKVQVWYKRFLYLTYLYPEKTIVPTKDVDEFWHQHIMDTKKYLADCNNILGYIVHHYPYIGTQGKKDKKELNRLFEETLALFKKHFDRTPASSSLGGSICGGGGGGGGGCKKVV